MKKQLKKLLTALVLCMTTVVLACGCGSKKETKKEVTVTFMNGTEELGKLTITEGSTVTGYEAYEVAEGQTFLGWYATPTFLASSQKNLTKETIGEDITLYASFKSNQVTEDTRTWTIVGKGKGEALALSNWNNGCEDALVTFVATGNAVNEFTLTVDLFKGDQFQVIHDHDWADQRGYGKFTDLDATMFENGGGLGGSPSTSNVNVIMDGNYTITIVTDPDNASLDRITIVRNGDPKGAVEESDDAPFVPNENSSVVVKGSWVADWSENKELTREADTNRFSIEMELEAGTELYFMIWQDGEDTGLGMKYSSVAEESKAFLEEADNVKVKEAGTFIFTADIDAMTITVTK